MSKLRIKSVSPYIRSLLLLFVLSQNMLLAHEAEHAAQHTDSGCQICILAQSGSIPGQGKIILVSRNATFQGLQILPSVLPLAQTPVRNYHSRAPPQV